MGIFQGNCEILRVMQETPRVKSFLFLKPKNFYAIPGQFLMVCMPSFDEVPMSISFCTSKKFGISVFKVGETTEKLHSLKAGNFLRLRGPYGNGFRYSGKKICLVGGGCGAAPLAFLAEEAAKKGIKVTTLIGAKTKNDLLFLKRFEKVANVEAASDDGSYGFKGFVTELLKQRLEKEKFDCVYTCGPELMMKKVFEICSAKKIKLQASLERFMKCGCGLCGSCLINGQRVCADGPVFELEKLKEFEKFGKKIGDE